MKEHSICIWRMQSPSAATATSLACITGGIAEAFYGMPQELRNETLKRLPEDLWAAYDLFRQNLKRKM